MNASNINALMKNAAYTDVKASDTPKQDVSKKFSDVMTKVNEKENKPQTEVKAEKQADDTYKLSEETAKQEQEIDKGLKQLMELLMAYAASTQNPLNSLKIIDKQDIDKLSQIISELLTANTSEVEKNNFLLENLKAFQFKADSQDTLANRPIVVNEKNAATELVYKLLEDPSVKAQLISKLDEILESPLADEGEGVKETLINQLSTMLNKKDSIKTENSEVLKNVQPIETKQFVEKSEAYTNTDFTTAKDMQSTEVYEKTVNKEDKLLTDLITESSSKNSKENISDRIANVVTRFESIRQDKTLPVNTQVTISKASFNADFVKAVKFMDINNIKELSVKILPKDLGEIIIKLSMDNGIMKANITTANKETYNLLNSNLPAISNQLAEQNMNIQSFNLSLYNGENFLFSGNGGFQEEGRKQGKRAPIDGIEHDETQVQGYETEETSLNALA